MEFAIDEFAPEWRAVLRTLDHAEREAHAKKIAKCINQFLDQKRISMQSDIYPEAVSQNHELKSQGILNLGSTLVKSQIHTLRKHFDSCPSYNHHLNAKSDHQPQSRGDELGPFASYHLADIIAAPFIVELANSPSMIQIAEQYLGCVPTIYSLNCWWSFPAGFDPKRVTQSFHRDNDDFRFLSAFIYLNDVDELNGPHQYVPQSHTVAGLERILLRSLNFDTGLGIEAMRQSQPFQAVMKILNDGQINLASKQVESIFGDNYLTFTGTEGTTLIATPCGFHRGLPPLERPRLMLWIRYGMHYNWASARDQIKPIEFDNSQKRLINEEKTRYINRLILKFRE